jgi:hypothetical protein
MEGTDSDESGLVVAHAVTGLEMLNEGLRIFYTEERILRAELQSTNVSRFMSKYGVHPVTACTIYENLQTTTVVEAVIHNPGPTTLK